MELSGLNVTIMGLGRHGGGVATARHCAQAGARVTVTDLASANTLAESIAPLNDLPIQRFVIGRHDADDFRHADVVVVNPAVRPDDELVALARKNGAQITSEIELFLDACPAQVVGVTGTVGKSTTAAMLDAILKKSDRPCWLGGNIGHSLLPEVDQIQHHDVVVLELSSFQLHWLTENARWPSAALVTNCLTNHLQWHGTREHYVASKQHLIRHLPAGGFAIFGGADHELSRWHSLLPRNVTCLDPWSPSRIPELLIPGNHNRTNAALAAAVGGRLGVAVEVIATALAEFQGLPHRIEFVGEVAGRRFYNDSKSTTPAATIAALASMDRPTWLLLGGVEQQLEYSELMAAVVNRAAGAAFFGGAASRLEQLARDRDNSFRTNRSANLREAFLYCWNQSRAGDTILLSPACPSTDQFRDFTHRGEEFTRLARVVGINHGDTGAPSLQN
ncbi:MAG TPA: Mur ligase family protein [Pirellulales bacterium]